MCQHFEEGPRPISELLEIVLKQYAAVELMGQPAVRFQARADGMKQDPSEKKKRRSQS